MAAWAFSFVMKLNQAKLNKGLFYKHHTAATKLESGPV